MAPRLGEILLKANLITRDQLEQAIAQQKVSGGPLGAILIKRGFVTEADVARGLAEQYGIPYIDVDTHVIDPALIRLIPFGIAQKHLAIRDPETVAELKDARIRRELPAPRRDLGGKRTRNRKGWGRQEHYGPEPLHPSSLWVSLFAYFTPTRP